MKLHTIILFLMCAGLFTACNPKTETAATEEEQTEGVTLSEEQYLSANIKSELPRVQLLNTFIKANGFLDVPPYNLVSVSAMLGGFVKHTDMLQGMKVKKGQVLCVLEDPGYIKLQQEYLETKSQLEYLEADYKRQEDLAKENISAQKTLQQAKSVYYAMLARNKSIHAQLAMVKVDLKKLESGSIQSVLNITSPIDGYITQVNVNIGTYVNPQDIIVKIVDTEHLHAELAVFEKDLPLLKVGQKVWFKFASENKERTATVHLIGREISTDRSVRVHCHLDKEDKQLVPGMYITARIAVTGKEALTVPESAVVRFGSKHYVFAQTENKLAYTPIEVSTGDAENGYVSIQTDSINLSQLKLVTNGAYDLLSKMMNVADED